ncbi:MAG: hemerythrin domain-containing protein [Actinomycetota bacterium]|nr:hemerythrin domain-containing protein [Actinomycetota bacterium]
MLRDDHKSVERMFKAVEKGDLSVVPEICEALTVHATIEELVFYPAVRAEGGDAKEDIGEAVEEHHLVKILIEELGQLPSEDEAYKSKATVLMELVRHHVKEEEDELFPKVRSELGRNRLLELGDEMMKLQANLVGQPA